MVRALLLLLPSVERGERRIAIKFGDVLNLRSVEAYLSTQARSTNAGDGFGGISSAGIESGNRCRHDLFLWHGPTSTGGPGGLRWEDNFTVALRRAFQGRRLPRPVLSIVIDQPIRSIASRPAPHRARRKSA